MVAYTSDAHVLSGYRGTLSGDLQQLASRVIWMNNLWSQVKSVQQVKSTPQINYREHDRRDEERSREGCSDEVRRFEDHQGEGFQLSNNLSSPLDKAQDVGSGRQVVIAPRSDQATRGKGRVRDRRSNGRGRGKKGRGISRSRSRDKLRAEQRSCEVVTATNAVLDIDNTPSLQAETSTKKKNPRAEGIRGAGSKNGRKRKRSGTVRVVSMRSTCTDVCNCVLHLKARTRLNKSGQKWEDMEASKQTNCHFSRCQTLVLMRIMRNRSNCHYLCHWGQRQRHRL